MSTLKELNLSKIHQIQHKLQLISKNNFTQFKDKSHEKLHLKISSLEKDLNSQTKLYESTIRQIKQHLHAMEKKHQQTQTRKQLLQHQRMIQVQKIKRKISNYFSNQLQEQNIIDDFVEKKVGELAQSIDVQVERRKTYLKNLEEELSKDIPEAHNEVRQKIYESNKKLQNLEEELENQRQEVEKKLTSLQEEQDQSHEQLMRMMSSVIAEIQDQIDQEKQQREQGKQKLIKLFKEAYDKFNSLN